MRTDSSTTPKLGIIAGAGRFPFMVADGARQAGCHVTIVGLKGFADPSIAAHADEFRWAGMTKMGRWIRIFKRQKIRSIILAGSVTKSSMYGRFRLLRLLPDLTAAKIWFLKLKDKRNDAVLSAVADEFAQQGMTMEECVKYSQQDMAPPGALTRTQPNRAQTLDADFGWTIAKQMGDLDIGQSIAVKETEVVAVEAIEGTDRMINRAGDLVRNGGWSMIKVAKPNQDMRFDVPTVGPDTVANLAQHGAKMLVIEAGKTVIVDRKKTIADADRAGIVILSRSEP